MLATPGYQRRGMKLGEGWPVKLNWNQFTGLTKSGLNVDQLTRIITSMPTNTGIDPNMQVEVNNQEGGGAVQPK